MLTTDTLDLRHDGPYWQSEARIGEAAVPGPPQGGLDDPDCEPLEEYEELEAAPHSMCDGPEASVNQEKISEGNEEVPIETHFWMKLEVSENESVHAPDAFALHQPVARVMRTEMPSEGNDRFRSRHIS